VCCRCWSIGSPTLVSFSTNTSCSKLQFTRRRIGNRMVASMTSLFQPFDVVPHNQTKKQQGKEDEESTSSRLLSSYGVVRNAGPGSFHLLPLGLRSLAKIEKIIEQELNRVGCQKVALPQLTPASLWKRSGRLEGQGKEVLRFMDRHDREVILAPTHEETITAMMAGLPVITPAHLPLRLYQIGAKFRDEMKPRFGLIRACEFTMQDLYTFDQDPEAARETYQEVSNAYRRIFTRLGVPFTVVQGDSSSMGGASSHEYHFPAKIGQDTLLLCHRCNAGFNSELGGEEEGCKECGGELKESKGIEVGHTFLLGTRYSQPFKALFRSESGANLPLQMGCYGIGVSRVLAASVEVLSSPTELRWPLPIAPYTVALLKPKAGSKEEMAASSMLEALQAQIETIFPDDTIADDRGKLTVGKKLREARKTGYPYLVVAGKGVLEENPLLELHCLFSGEVTKLTPGQVVDKLAGVKIKLNHAEL